MVSRVVQKDWKRTQLRLPSSHYEAVLADVLGKGLNASIVLLSC